MAVLAAVVTAASLAYSNDRVADLTRTVIPPGVLRDEASGPTEVQNFLIVGVDDAADLPEGDAVKVREDGGKRTDTIMILRLDPMEQRADILSFPRDLYVPIAGSRADGRINSAFNTGGPVKLIQTIDEDFGIPIDHYIEMDFAGFRELVDVIGGVPVQFPRPTRSVDSVELDIPTAGCWVLGPRQALGFSRVRKDYQVQDDDGDWHTDLGGDFSRIERQQLFVELALRQAITKGARNPNTLRRLVELGGRSLTLDAELAPEVVVDLGAVFRDFDPADLVTHTLPVDEAEPGGPAYLYLREDEAEPILALFRDAEGRDLATVRPEGVVVRVRNGTGTPGQAGDVTEGLADIGFETLVPDADVEVGFPTLVVYEDGSEAAAQAVARSVAGPVTYRVGPVSEEGSVVLITGTDWVGLAPEPRPAEEVAPPTSIAPADEAAPDAAEDDPSTTTTPSGSDVPNDLGDPSDPDDPAFYRAGEPLPGAECLPTP